MTAGMSRLLAPLAVLLLTATAVTPLEARIRVRMGTVAPKGSAWHDALEYIRQEWRKISGGEIDMTIYPGGVLGDDPEMVNQVRQRRIQAVALSAVGLSRIDPGVECLNIPLMFRSYEELDYVRDRIAPRLEQRLEAQGFKLLNWSDAGWIRFFTKNPARTPDDIRGMKLFTHAGDPESEKLFKELGLQVVPLALADMFTALQTGMIDGLYTVPLFAMLERSYTRADNMLDLKISPLVAGTVISKDVWDRIPASYKDQLLKAARDRGDQLRDEIRRLGEDSIREMKQRGLNVIEPDAETGALWQREIEASYPKLRGRLVPADLFDEVQRLRDEYRAKSGAP